MIRWERVGCSGRKNRKKVAVGRLRKGLVREMSDGEETEVKLKGNSGEQMDRD